MKVCPNCKKEVDDGVAFCPACGTKLGETAPAPQPQKPKGPDKLRYVASASVFREPTKLVVGVLVAVIGLILVVAGFALKYPVLGGVSIAVVVVGILITVYAFVSARHCRIEIYDTYIVERSGVFFTSEKRSVLTPIIGVRVEQGIFGHLFNFGSIHIDKMGKGWDISTEGIREPQKLKAYLDTLISNTDYRNVGGILTN